MPRKSRIRRKGNRRRTVRRKKIRGGIQPCPFVTYHGMKTLQETANIGTIHLEERTGYSFVSYNVFDNEKTLLGVITEIPGKRGSFGVPSWLETGVEYKLNTYTELLDTPGKAVGQHDYLITIEKPDA